MTDIILFLVSVTLALAMAIAIGRAIFLADNTMNLADNIMNQQDERAHLLRKQLDFMTDKAVKLEQALMKRDKEIERLVHTIQEMQDERNRMLEPKGNRGFEYDL